MVNTLNLKILEGSIKIKKKVKNIIERVSEFVCYIPYFASKINTKFKKTLRFFWMKCGMIVSRKEYLEIFSPFFLSFAFFKRN